MTTAPRLATTTPPGRGIGRWCAVAWGVLVVGLWSQAGAQLLPAPLPELETKAGELEAGTWVKYAVRKGRGQQPFIVRMAALAKQGRGQWFEFSFVGPMGRSVVFRALVEGRLTAPKRVRSAAFQIAGQPALAVPPEMLEQRMSSRPRAKSGKGSRKGKGRGKVVGRGKVRVPAGVFRATRYRRRDRKGRRVDAWISTQVPGWRLVKLEGPDLSLELVGHGKSARSQIRGTPASIDSKMLEAFGIFLR